MTSYLDQKKLASNVLNRVLSHGKGAIIWCEGNIFTIRKKPNLSRGVKFAYWDCAHPGCKVSCKTADIDSLCYIISPKKPNLSIKHGRTKVHCHGNITCGEIIRMKMVEKGKLRGLTKTKSIGKILEYLEMEYVTKENYTNGNRIGKIYAKFCIASELRTCQKFHNRPKWRSLTVLKEKIR